MVNIPDLYPYPSFVLNRTVKAGILTLVIVGSEADNTRNQSVESQYWADPKQQQSIETLQRSTIKQLIKNRLDSGARFGAPF